MKRLIFMAQSVEINRKEDKHDIFYDFDHHQVNLENVNLIIKKDLVPGTNIPCEITEMSLRNIFRFIN